MEAAEPPRPQRDETAEREDAAIEASREMNEPASANLPRDEFLVPGPTSSSDEGLMRWGLSWIIFSLVLMVMMGLISFVCLVLANWTGLA